MLRQRPWCIKSQDLELCLQRLGGAEAVVKLVQVTAVTDDWSTDLGQEVSRFWELISDNESEPQKWDGKVSKRQAVEKVEFLTQLGKASFRLV